jgi:surfeit locus 1 family protein
VMRRSDRATPPRSITISAAGVIGTIAIAIVIVLCIRLGFWQLDRLRQRRALNVRIATRLTAPAIADAGALADTAGVIYRVFTARGTYDNARSIVLPGRSYRGSPGVHVLSPLRLVGRSDAVLVNRGWIPSADAATVPLEQFAQLDTLTVRGLVLPFPGAGQSLAPAARAASSADTGFRRTWFRVDAAALRAQYPYPLLPVTVQELPAANADRYPVRLEPPALDEGPHLGYAMQWFSFALVGVIGWLALVLRRRGARAAAPVAVTALIALAPAAAHGQLRPLDPLEWRVYDPGTFLVAEAGGGSLWKQHATLAGTRGRLLELGNYRVTFRFDRMAVELAGTALWRLTDEEVVAPPAAWVDPPNGSPRQDAGFASAATLVDLTPPWLPVDVIVRFGARIPTTSDESGLDRDRTDFFALAGLRYQAGPLSFTAENGVGIHGAIDARFPQSDVWAYTFGAEYRTRPLFATAHIVGHQNGLRLRGNEDLRELRLGGGIGDTRWLTISYIRGLTEFSPRHGLRLGAGFRLSPLVF